MLVLMVLVLCGKVDTVLLDLLLAVSRSDWFSVHFQDHCIAWHFNMRLAADTAGGPSWPGTHLTVAVESGNGIPPGPAVSTFRWGPSPGAQEVCPTGG